MVLSPSAFSRVVQTEARRRIWRDVQAFKTTFNSIRNKGIVPETADDDRICSLMHMAYVFEIEQLCMLRDWDPVLASVEVRFIRRSARLHALARMTGSLSIAKGEGAHV